MGATSLKKYNSLIDNSPPDIFFVKEKREEVSAKETKYNSIVEHFRDPISSKNDSFESYNLIDINSAGVLWGSQSVWEEATKEFYQTEDTAYSRVDEITEHFVIGSCLVNEKEGRFQKRRYNKDVLSELNLKENDIIEVTIFTKPGEIKSTYKKTTNPEVLNKFERKRKDYFKGLENSPLFQPLPSEE